ncbi:hypothetical protein DFH06DRAFT_1133685 [Mycena polygramma]|nr:hypothetical protein DFH06DRAFT_1133685 [Mycena polygramma]
MAEPPALGEPTDSDFFEFEQGSTLAEIPSVQVAFQIPTTIVPPVVVQMVPRQPRIEHQVLFPGATAPVASTNKRAEKCCAPCSKAYCERRLKCNGRGKQTLCGCGHPLLARGEKLRVTEPMIRAHFARIAAEQQGQTARTLHRAEECWGGLQEHAALRAQDRWLRRCFQTQSASLDAHRCTAGRKRAAHRTRILRTNSCTSATCYSTPCAAVVGGAQTTTATHGAYGDVHERCRGGAGVEDSTGACETTAVLVQHSGVHELCSNGGGDGDGGAQNSLGGQRPRTCSWRWRIHSPMQAAGRDPEWHRQSAYKGASHEFADAGHVRRISILGCQGRSKGGEGKGVDVETNGMEGVSRKDVVKRASNERRADVLAAPKSIVVLPRAEFELARADGQSNSVHLELSPTRLELAPSWLRETL